MDVLDLNKIDIEKRLGIERFIKRDVLIDALQHCVKHLSTANLMTLHKRSPSPDAYVAWLKKYTPFYVKDSGIFGYSQTRERNLPSHWLDRSIKAIPENVITKIRWNRDEARNLLESYLREFIKNPGHHDSQKARTRIIWIFDLAPAWVSPYMLRWLERSELFVWDAKAKKFKKGSVRPSDFTQEMYAEVCRTPYWECKPEEKIKYHQDEYLFKDLHRATGDARKSGPVTRSDPKTGKPVAELKRDAVTRSAVPSTAPVEVTAARSSVLTSPPYFTPTEVDIREAQIFREYLMQYNYKDLLSIWDDRKNQLKTHIEWAVLFALVKKTDKEMTLEAAMNDDALLNSLPEELWHEEGDKNQSTIADGYQVSGEDERHYQSRSVATRPGQDKFREDLIKRYGPRCMVTGCDIIEAVDAAHIVGFRGVKDHHVENGLLLRADIHRLFDAHLIAIEPETLIIHLSQKLANYDQLGIEGTVLNVPKGQQPSSDALDVAWQKFKAVNKQ